jgi:hypothetical protein
MNQYGSLDPPLTLTERLSRLNDSLQSLGVRLKASIASLVGDAIGEAVRDSVRNLLGSKEVPSNPYHDHRDHHAPAHSHDRVDNPWGEEDRWSGTDDEVYATARDTPAAGSDKHNRWGNAMSAALQACLWFLKQQPRRRPLLTTVCVTLAAGVTGFIAGPLLAASAGVLASVASLLLTAESSKSAAELATE